MFVNLILTCDLTLFLSKQQQQPAVQGGQAAQGKGKNEPGIGALLMKKMGYKEGAGLGRDEQGITKAIRHKATGGGQGTIEGPRITKTAAAPGVPGAPASSDRKGKKRGGLFSNPTKIVLLKNMVGPGELDDELQAETAEECAKHGPVKQCLIFEVSRIAPNEIAASEVKIFFFSYTHSRTPKFSHLFTPNTQNNRSRTSLFQWRSVCVSLWPLRGKRARSRPMWQ